MKIFLIEDNLLKVSQIQDFLNATYADIELEIYGSFQSGLKAIQSTLPSLIILDITLPTFDKTPNSREGRLRPLGGYDLMRKLKLRQIEAKVIVVTQLESFAEDGNEISFDELCLRCQDEFSKMFIGGIQFKQTDINWQDELKKCIDTFREQK